MSKKMPLMTTLTSISAKFKKKKPIHHAFLKIVNRLSIQEFKVGKGALRYCGILFKDTYIL